MPENPVRIQIITFQGSRFEGTWLNFADLRTYMDQLRAEPRHAGDVDALDKLEEALVGAIMERDDSVEIDLSDTDFLERIGG